MHIKKIILLITMLLLCVSVVSAYTVVIYNATTIKAPYNSSWNGPVQEVRQGEYICPNTYVDLRQVAGWDMEEGERLLRISDGRIIDITDYTFKIFVDPTIFTEGEYDQYSGFDEPNANLLAFFVNTTCIPKNIANVSVKQIGNITALNTTAVDKPKYKLEERVISDILLARGDALSFNSTTITNKSTAWLFGTKGGIYEYPCNQSRLIIPSKRIDPLEPGLYYVLIDSPGTNTLPEAQYDNAKKVITSPIRKTPELNINGDSPRNIYDKIVPWLRQYSDDTITIFKMELQEPFVEIVGVRTAYTNRTDVFEVTGYTNLAINTEVYAAIDEDNRTMGIINTPRTYAKVFGDIGKPGTMREFTIYPPFDYENKTVGHHSVWVHGPFKIFAKVDVPIGLIPAGQEVQQEYIKYANGTIWHPTPTPQIIIQKEPVPGPTRIVIQTVTPSDEQVYAQQMAAQDKINTENWYKATIVVFGVVFVVGGTFTTKYLLGVYRRAKKLKKV